MSQRQIDVEGLTDACPNCAGHGYEPVLRQVYRHGGFSERVKVDRAKKCKACCGTGVNVEHLLFSVLKLDVKSVPPMEEMGYKRVKKLSEFAED